MRRLAFIVTFLVGTVGAFQWLSQGFSTTWEPRLRSYLETVAGRLTRTEVHIDSISPGFFHRVRLVNVRVTEPKAPDQTIFQASDIELTVSLIDLPRAILHRKPYEAIGLISLKSPVVQLSQEILEKHRSHSVSSSSLPLWFTLAWEGGTVRWSDPNAPNGAWTIYQAQGAYRVRGPQMNFAVRGSVQEARSLRFQFSSLAHRWNAQLYVSDGYSQSAITGIETLLKRPILPAGWRARGGFHLEAHASGRMWPIPKEDILQFLDKAELTFIPEPRDLKPEVPSVGITGTLTYRKGIISSPHLVFDSPWLEGTGRVDLSLDGPRERPEIRLDAALSSGHLGKWPFKDAVIQTRYLQEHWEFLQNTFHFLDGHVSAKGYVSPVGSDLAITAENISLSALGHEQGLSIPEGHVNVSCALKGPSENWQIAGAWWLTGFQWGDTPVGDARGDFEFTRDHFQAQAKSDNSRFRFALEGNRSDKSLDVERLEMFLPSGASFTGNGRLSQASRQIQGNLDVQQIHFPSDLPFLPLQRKPLKGILDAQIRLSGTLDEPVVKGNLQGTQATAWNQALGKISASFLGSKTQWEMPTFRIEPGVEGRYARGQGDFKIQNAALGKWSFPRGALRFEVKPDALHVSELSLETPDTALNWQGNASRSKDKTIALQGQGKIHSTVDPDAFDIPFDVSGHLESTDKGWTGSTRVTSARPLFRKKIMEPFQAVLRWDPAAFTWSDTHWGRRWTSEGSLRWDSSPAVWSARLEANRVPLAEWQPLLWPQRKDELQGLLSGTFKLTGTSAHPLCDLSFHVDEGRWRAFQFSTDLQGTWSDEGIKPLTLKGRFKTGGDFQFSGAMTPAGLAQGTLKLSGFNLKPLGESLKFPKPLDGSTTATLTLSGPLARLKWNGHLEGGPFVYAPTSERPFKLEKVTMDMTLAPLDNDASVSRLTLTEAQVKTAEELIRFRPGSFIDFAGQKSARLAVGTEIRNLHLGIFTLFGGLDLDGNWQIKSDGFALQTQARSHSLFINDYELEEGLLLADYYAGVLKFSAPPNTPPLVTGTIDFHKAPQLKFTDFFISGKDAQGLELSGDIGPTLWDFHMVGRGLDMGILGELAGFPYSISGAADVQVHGTGDPKHPHVDGKIDLDRGTVLGLSFRSGSAVFIWQDARITFTKLLLNDPGHYNLEGAGVFPLISKEKMTTENHEIDFSVRLRDSNLSLLQSFSQEVKEAKGPVEGLIQIKGTLEDPLLKGSVRVTNGQILGAHYFRELRGANLFLEFNDDTVTIRDLRGKSGNGEFRGSGSVTLSGFQPSKYDLALEIVSSKGLDVQVPELAIPESPLAKRFKFLTTSSRADVRGHVALRGPASAPVFSGLGIFSNGHFTFPPSRKNPPPAAVLEWFRRIYWDVDLTFQDGAWFENELVQANVVGKLSLKGPSDKLKVNGGLDIPEGKISYLGLQFDIQQARYDLRSETNGDQVTNTPYLRGVAECQIQAVDTVTGVSGGSRLNTNDVITLNIDYAPVDQIEAAADFRGQPELSQDKLLARATRTDVDNLTPQERNYMYQKQLVSLIDSSLTTPLAQNVLKKTGIADRLHVQHVFDPNAVTGQDLNTTSSSQQQSTTVSLLSNTKYTVEKDLSNRLSLGYGVRFVPSAVVDPVAQQQKLDLISDVQLSYRWFRNIYLKGDFELPSSNPNILPERKVTIEPRWRFGWWGNTNKEKTSRPK